MAIDLRATITCSLGPVISGSVSDSFIQGAGLITTTGDCVIDGIITPSIGQTVTIGYIKNGLARNIPRVLRVLSFFANPFTKQTTVSLGCKLTYLSGLSEAVDWTAFDDPENADRTEEEQEIVTIPISARSVAQECLSQLGLQSSGGIPLTNKFSISEFDFSPGYVTILNDLLVSESFFGYLDQREVFRVRPLGSYEGSTPIFSEANIIEVGAVNSGELPGEAVTVSYNTLKLNEEEVDPDSVNPYNWDREILVGQRKKIVWGEWPEDAPIPAPTLYYTPRTEILTEYDSWDRVTRKITTEESILAETAPGYVDGEDFSESAPSLFSPEAQELYILQRRSLAIARLGPIKSEKITETVYTYKYTSRRGQVKPEDYDTVKVETTTTKEPGVVILTRIGLKRGDLAFSESMIQHPSARTIVSYESVPFGTKIQLDAMGGKTPTGTTTDRRFVSKVLTRNFELPEIGNFAALYFSGAHLIESGSTMRTVTGRSVYAETRPDAASRAAASNGFSVQSTAGLELAIGSAQANLRVEFSMPYAPDDIFVKVGDGYTSRPSDAPQKAKKFGRIQNKMLLGNRNGMNIQTIPEAIPNAPFASIVIRANGTSALYRTNGVSWTFSNTGIVASVDAMYWGVVGRSS